MAASTLSGDSGLDKVAEVPWTCQEVAHHDHNRHILSDLSLKAVCVQAWEGGLEHFLSSAPSDTAVNEVAEILSDTSNGGEVIMRTMNATSIPKHGPTLGMYPSFLVFDRDHRYNALTYLCASSRPLSCRLRPPTHVASQAVTPAFSSVTPTTTTMPSPVCHTLPGWDALNQDPSIWRNEFPSCIGGTLLPKAIFATARGGLEASAAVTVAFCGIKYTGKLTSSCSAA